MNKLIRQNAPNAKSAPGKAAGKPVVKTTTETGRQVVKSKAKVPAKTKAPKPPKREKGFWGIVAGTRKEQVAIALDAAGKEAAMKKAKALGLAEGSVKGWIGTWKRDGRYVEAKTPDQKKAVKKAAEKLQDIAVDAGAEVADKATNSTGKQTA